ncbi:DUF2510 domain-containing protein [Mycolicibacterium sp. SCSIO 43805]|uniref:DUF2510 domain-containing protein n=1 Tax=Mycolicibacterium sp. SCSIO 43805 TaxID=3378074 RepID=UPI003AB4748F
MSEALAGWYPDPEGRGQRYFDGTRWTEHRSAGLTERQRADILDRAIISAHCRVLNRSATAASVVMGQPVNHVVHVLLTLFLCGLWAPVWLFIAATNGEKYFTVTVDEYGTVQWISAGGKLMDSGRAQ